MISKKGVALIWVVTTITGIMILAGGAATASYRALRTVTNSDKSLNSYYLARSGLEYASKKPCSSGKAFQETINLNAQKTLSFEVVGSFSDDKKTCYVKSTGISNGSKRTIKANFVVQEKTNHMIKIPDKTKDVLTNLKYSNAITPTNNLSYFRDAGDIVKDGNVNGSDSSTPFYQQFDITAPKSSTTAYGGTLYRTVSVSGSTPAFVTNGYLLFGVENKGGNYRLVYKYSNNGSSDVTPSYFTNTITAAEWNGKGHDRIRFKITYANGRAKVLAKDAVTGECLGSDNISVDRYHFNFLAAQGGTQSGITAPSYYGAVNGENGLIIGNTNSLMTYMIIGKAGYDTNWIEIPGGQHRIGTANAKDSYYSSSDYYGVSGQNDTSGNLVQNYVTSLPLDCSPKYYTNSSSGTTYPSNIGSRSSVIITVAPQYKALGSITAGSTRTYSGNGACTALQNYAMIPGQTVTVTYSLSYYGMDTASDPYAPSIYKTTRSIQYIYNDTPKANSLSLRLGRNEAVHGSITATASFSDILGGGTGAGTIFTYRNGNDSGRSSVKTGLAPTYSFTPKLSGTYTVTAQYCDIYNNVGSDGRNCSDKISKTISISNPDQTAPSVWIQSGTSFYGYCSHPVDINGNSCSTYGQLLTAISSRSSTSSVATYKATTQNGVRGYWKVVTTTVKKYATYKYTASDSAGNSATTGPTEYLLSTTATSAPKVFVRTRS